LKLIIQIPCFNEEAHLPVAIADLPRTLPGVDAIEYLVIDDGSSDRTSEVARLAGVHHVVRFAQNRGLAAGFMAGLDAALRLGADIVVNTDADNQYCAEDIGRLIAPILVGKADMVVGDRQTDQIAHFSPLKKMLQRWGSAVVRGASGTDVADATSGFRAFNRACALRLFVHNRFSYTLETLIQSGRSGLSVVNVTVRTNPMSRPSRLAKSAFDYVRRNGTVIVRSFAMYRPLQTFAAASAVFLLLGAILIGRFFVLYLAHPAAGGHAQSLILGVGSIILSFTAGMMAVLGDLLAANRRLNESLLMRVRGIEVLLRSELGDGEDFSSKPDERPVSLKASGDRS